VRWKGNETEIFRAHSNVIFTVRCQNLLKVGSGYSSFGDGYLLLFLLLLSPFRHQARILREYTPSFWCAIDSTHIGATVTISNAAIGGEKEEIFKDSQKLLVTSTSLVSHDYWLTSISPEIGVRINALDSTHVCCKAYVMRIQHIISRCVWSPWIWVVIAWSF